MAEEGHVPPRDIGRTKTSAPTEHGAPTEILLVKMMWITTTFPNFPVYLILLQLLVLLRQILLQCFKCLFKPNGAGTFLQTHVLIVFFFFLFSFLKRRTFRLNYVLLLKTSKSTKWTDPLESDNSMKSTKVDGPHRRRDLPRGWNIHKTDGPPKGWKFYQPHKSGQTHQRVKNSSSQSGRIP